MISLLATAFVIVFLLISLFFNCLGVISLYRFPDVYTRLHGATKCTTFGTLFSIFALLVYSFGRIWTSGGQSRFLVFFIHAVIAGAVLLISNPTGGHALARAAHRSGVLPEPAIVDALEEKEKEMKTHKKSEGGEAA